MCIDEHTIEAAEIAENQDTIFELEKQGWKHYSNYLNPDLLKKGIERLKSKGKEHMTLEEASDYAGRTLPDSDAVSLWYRD